MKDGGPLPEHSNPQIPEHAVQHVLALDQGTTSSRALVFGPEGRIHGRGQEEFAQHFPRDGWVEHDPADLWQTQLRTARAALEKAGADARDLAALGITNQRETTLIWDRTTGEPIYPAIVWQDRRTVDLCDQLKGDGREPLFRKKTGLVLDPYFSGTKIRWLLDHVDGARERAEAGKLAFGTVDTWLIWKLTGGAESGNALHVTDATNASRTLLYDIHEGRWDDDLLEALNVPRALLPEVRPSSAVYGETAPDVLGAPVPIAGVAGDQQAALFGQRCTRPGMAKSTCGTGAFVLMHTGTDAVRSENKLLTTVALERSGGRTTYALEGSIFVAGAVVQWLRDGLGLIEHSAEVETLARQVESSEGVVLVPAFTGLGAPHWDPRARGAAFGLTRAATDAHLARAALESITHQVADVLGAMERDAGLRADELRVDGGATANDLLLQLHADLLGVPATRPQTIETTALGAAHLAGLAVGFWEREEIDAQWQKERGFRPAMDEAHVQQQRARWHRAVERTKGWA